MQLLQLLEEVAGGGRVQRHASQAFTQGLEQAWHLLQQLLAGLMRGNADEQGVHGGQGITPHLRAFALLEPGQQQHLAPGLHQHLYHHPGQYPPAQALV
ncbi:hypothetical protein D3C80_1921750 [compost metagenome]